MAIEHPNNSSNQTENGPPQRRSFLGWLTFAIGGAAAGLAGVPIVGYFFRTPQPKPRWIGAGAVKDFPKNETHLVTFQNPLQQPWDGITAQCGVFVRNEGTDEKGQPRFMVLAMNCAHLGCPVTWFPESGLFMCPCHGGVYYANGERASGPPPRGMFHCVWRINGDQLEVQAPHFPTLQDTETVEEQPT